MAGKDWLMAFMKRHNFSHRKAEHTSVARAYGFNEHSVQEFFTQLKVLMDKYNFQPTNIYNVDETGVSVVPKSSPKIVAKKGQKQIGGLVAVERGETVTAEICMSASGYFLPSMLIFPRVRENPEFLTDKPNEAWAEFHKSGYMQTDIFTRWFKKFIEFSHASLTNPVLLLFDQHVTHVKNLEVIELARQNGVEILCFPPHCTHKMQPLDVGFNGPLNGCFGKDVNSFQRDGKRVTLKNIFSIFGKAFMKAAKVETAVNSFKKCGIYPFNPNIFTSSDFAKVPQESFSSPTESRNDEFNAKVSHYSNMIADIVKNTNQCSNDLDTSNNQIGESSNMIADMVKNKNQCSNDLDICINQIDESEPVTNIEESNSISQIEPLSSHETTEDFHSSALPTSESSIDTQRNFTDMEIKIPLAYIMEAKPLIKFLNSCVDSYSDNNLRNSSPSAFISTLANSPVDILNASQSICSTPVSNHKSLPKKLSLDETPVSVSSKSRKRGKAEIITTEEYLNNLIAEKAKNIEKEKAPKNKVSKGKPVIQSDVPVDVALPLKRRKTTNPKNARKPLKDLNYQLPFDSSSVGSFQPQPTILNQPNLELTTNQISFPMESQTTFLNGQPIEICYIDENYANLFNIT